MKITYDPEVDAMYIYLVDGKHECRTVQLSDEMALDFGDGETLVGIEILDATRVLGKGKLPKLIVNDRAFDWPSAKAEMVRAARANGGTQAKARRRKAG